MRPMNEREDTRRGSGAGYRQSMNRPRRPAPRRRRRRAWPAAVLAALLCAGTVILIFCLRKGRPEPQPAGAENVPEAPPAAVVTVPAESVSPTAEAAETPAAPGAELPEGFEWLEWKEGQFVVVEYGKGTSTALDTSGFTDPATKNSHDLVEWAKMAWENQWGYVWGTFGSVLTEDLLTSSLKQYPDALDEYENIIREKWMGRRVTDCVGLIKCYGWYEPATGNIEYGYGDMPDVGADGMWDAAEVKGDIDTMPDEPGLLVYSTGHIGVYIGGGYAIEAISHTGGVVKTMVSDRPWTGWLQCPYIRYDF